jgi:uncharacterized protein (TIGR00661 family)
MKILFAIQGTGNGHISRAREIIPYLQQYGEVDILVSGTQVDMSLEQEVKYRFHGFSFIFGKKGGVDHYSTWKNMNLFQFRKDILSLPLNDYQLIINDFEPISAWACKYRGIDCVSLSHQASFKSPKVPRPRTIDWGKLILDRYAPTTQQIGFHFNKYDDFIYTPIIRQEIRKLTPKNLGHYTVYLPALDEKHLLPLLRQLPNVRWEVFSKHSNRAFSEGNIKVQPINNELFTESLAHCEGLFTGGGFESPAEALFLNKKLLVAPMRYQYEQQCNAFALKHLGIPVIWGSNHEWLPTLKSFVSQEQNHTFHFPDETAQIVERVVNTFSR